MSEREIIGFVLVICFTWALAVTCMIKYLLSL